MERLAYVARIDILVMLGLLAGVIVFKLLTRRINTGGLLRDQVTGLISPVRIQLLVSTIAVAGSLLLRMDRMLAEKRIIVPCGELSIVFGGSQLIYLIGKLRDLGRGSTLRPDNYPGEARRSEWKG